VQVSIMDEMLKLFGKAKPIMSHAR
jgi:hypothetical protein